MRLLVLYAARFASIGAIRDYLEGFQAHSRHEVFFMEAGDGAIPQTAHEPFDAVLVNFCCRLHYGSLFSDACEAFVAGFSGIRIVVLQDEQENTLAVRKRVAHMRPHILFTTLPPEAWPIVFPDDVFGETKIVRLLTGYARQRSLPHDLNLAPLAQRRLTLGYRVTPHVWRWGKLGRLKIEVGQRFHEACLRRGIPADIAWTEEAKIYGDNWLRFNASCQGVLGSESGASIFDWHGDLQRQETQFRYARPGATCEGFLSEVIEQEVSFDTGQVSPRVFEATITRTPLVMVEGKYAGVLREEEHYLAIKRDFSNVENILDRMSDLESLQNMVDRAYSHLIESGMFSYAVMSREIDKEIEQTVIEIQGTKSKNETSEPKPREQRHGQYIPLPSDLNFLASYPTKSPLSSEHALNKLAQFKNMVPDLTDVAQLGRTETLAIYGAGGGGKIVYQWLLESGRKADFFLDSMKDGEFCGLPILTRPTAFPGRKKLAIVIASQHFWEIACVLVSSGFTNIFNGNGIIKKEISAPESLFPYDL